MSITVLDLTDVAFTATCSPCCHEIQIIDDSVAPDRHLASADAVNDPHFRSFISSVEDHVLSKLEGGLACQENSDEESDVKLVFVRLPLVTSGDKPIAPAPSLIAPNTDLSCQLDSPWAKLVVQKATSLQVRAVFIWNERQFLLDQVVIAGAPNLIDTRPEPLARSKFERLAQDYADLEILRLPQANPKPIEDRIPADILWLFRHSWQSTRGPFSNAALGAMSTALEYGAQHQTKLVLALIDRCLASDSAKLHYNDILDVAGFVSLEQHKIDQPR